MTRSIILSFAFLGCICANVAAQAEPSASTMIGDIEKGDATALLSLNGFANGLGYANAELERRKQPALFCVPNNLAITPDQNLSILKRYVARYPQLGKEPYGAVALLAFRHTFPCRS